MSEYVPAKACDPFARKRQCGACPWKVSTDPHADIPGGYDPEKHAHLLTCRSEGFVMGPMMACHEAPPGAEYACVGWLDNQLGEGHNLPLRLHAKRIGRLHLDGEQYPTLEAMCDAAKA